VNENKFIIKQLQEKAKILGWSPGRRDISRELYRLCVKHFGSFNKSKDKAKLSFHKRNYNPMTKRSYLLDKDLVKIVSFLTCDGHLYKDLSGFLLISKDIDILKKL